LVDWVMQLPVMKVCIIDDKIACFHIVKKFNLRSLE